jgi:prefoldin subunit 5
MSGLCRVGYTQAHKESTQTIKESGRGLAETTVDAAKTGVVAAGAEITEPLEESADQIKKSAETLTKEIKEAASETTQQVKETTDEARQIVTDGLDQVKGVKDDATQVVNDVRDVISKEREVIQEELSSLRAQLEEAKKEATQELTRGSEFFRWNLNLSPNIDGSLAFDLGVDYKYLDQFLVGISYEQIRRIQRDECDQRSTNSCRAYADITDRQFTLRGFGYELPLGQSFQFTFNMNGIVLLQEREGTSVDVVLDRYIASRGGFRSLQLNAQLEIDWQITQNGYFHLEGSASPYHYSAEREEGYDSGLVSQVSQSVGRIGNENNLVYTGQLGNYTNYFYNDSSYFDGAANLYIKDLLGESDFDLSVSARYLSYGAQATRSVVYNGETKDIDAAQDFEKIDIFTKLAFELSFLGFTPINPMLGLTYTWSSFDGVNTTNTNHSVGFAVSFTTPPEIANSKDVK